MKTYRVTVNQIPYDVTVEETAEQPLPPIPVPIPISQPAPIPAAPAAPEPAPVQTPQSVPVNGYRLESPLPGTVIALKIGVGDTVEKNQIACVIEAMKMENEIALPVSGKVASISVNRGQTVNTGDLLMIIDVQS